MWSVPWFESRSSAARLLRLWVRIPPEHGCLSVVSVVCCPVEDSGTDWSLVQRSPTDCGASLCDQKTSKKTRRLKPVTGLWKIQTQWIVTPGKQTNKPRFERWLRGSEIASSHFRPHTLELICVLRVPSLIGIAEVRKPKCGWQFTCKLWFQIYTSHTSWFHSGTSHTQWFQTKTSLSPSFQNEVSRNLWFQGEKSLTRCHKWLNFFISKLGFSFRHF
jgi:hypothetical protein